MLRISRPVVDDVIACAKKGAPLETCGYLAAKKDGVAVRFYPMKNADQSAEHFSFDPAEQFSVARTARSYGLKIAAVVHSHPATPARMSEEDIRLARDPDMSYVILSLAGPQPVLKSFRTKDGIVSNEELEIVQ